MPLVKMLSDRTYRLPYYAPENDAVNSRAVLTVRAPLGLYVLAAALLFPLFE
jgi:hypothetical protein